MIQVELYKNELSQKTEELVASVRDAINAVEVPTDTVSKTNSDEKEEGFFLKLGKKMLSFFKKKSPKEDYESKSRLSRSYGQTANELFKEIERIHKENSTKWSEFIESQRQKLNAEIKSSGLEEALQTKMLDSQISNSVLRFKVIDELSVLNDLGRKGDSKAFEEYKEGFLNRYRAAVKDAKKIQFEIYDKLQ